jgi:hypothetical protein
MSFIKCRKLATGFAAVMFVFATSIAQAADNDETLLDFPDKQTWCMCQDAADDYENITKDSVFYEQVYRILGEGDSKIPLLNRWVAASLFKNGTELTRQGKYAEAIALFDELDRRFAQNEAGGRDEILSPSEWAAGALNNKGVALSRQGKLAEAIALYDNIIERDATPRYSEEMLALREELRQNMGDQFDQLNIDELLGKSDYSDWNRAVVVAAQFNKARIFQQQGKLAEALALYDAIGQRVRNDNRRENAEAVPSAEGGEVDEACEAEDAAPDAVPSEGSSEYYLNQFEEEDNPLIWQQLIKAQISKAEILEQQGKTEEADDFYGSTMYFMDNQYQWGSGYYSALVTNPALFQEMQVKAILKRGEALSKQGKFVREAMNYAYLGGALRWDDNLATRQTVFEVLLKWAESSSQREGEKRELRAYDLLYQFFSGDKDPVIHEQFIKGMIRLGDNLARDNESPLQVDLTLFVWDKNPVIRELVSSAFLRWAQVVGQQGDVGSEIEAYETLYSYFSDDREPAIRATVAQALHNLLEKASQPDEDGEIDEVYVADIRDAIERHSQAPVAEEVADALGTDDSSDGWWNDGTRKTESLSLLSPEAANQKLKPILISLFITDMDDNAETYDEIVQRFSTDENPAVQKQVGRALLHKAFALNHQEDKEKIAEAITLYDDVLQRFGNVIDVTGALGNAAEAALIIGRNEEAVARAKVLQAHPEASKQDNALMAFIIWLADPKTPLQNVQKAIHAAGNGEFHWSFKEVTPVIDSLPKARKKQAECFIEYFSQYLNEKELRACLKK